ncbi:hypothetical protein PR048_009668 [Dryococelus australis]|uniref:Uncharacterized protein n=1 Tax=Dryococelus australis TaxID=614101 RepID=A0ABQ9I0I7_9NEOP|nr:hypothetical protein PR048_009668 [Dryococelus australis]
MRNDNANFAFVALNHPTKQQNLGSWWCTGKTARLSPKQTGFDSRRGRLHIFACVEVVADDAAGQRISSGISLFHAVSFWCCSVLTSFHSHRLSKPRSVSLLASHQDDPGSIPGRVALDSRMWESCRTMPLVGGFSLGYTISSALPFRRSPIFTSITIIGSQDLNVKSRQNVRRHERTVCTKSLFCTMKHYDIGPMHFVQGIERTYRDVQGFVYWESASVVGNTSFCIDRYRFERKHHPPVTVYKDQKGKQSPIDNSSVTFKGGDCNVDQNFGIQLRQQCASSQPDLEAVPGGAKCRKKNGAAGDCVDPFQVPHHPPPPHSAETPERGRWEQRGRYPARIMEHGVVGTGQRCWHRKGRCARRISGWGEAAQITWDNGDVAYPPRTYVASSTRMWGRGGLMVRLLASHLGEPGSCLGGVAPRIVASGDRRRTMPPVGGFSRGSPPPPPSFHSGAAKCSPHFTLIDSQDLDVGSLHRNSRVAHVACILNSVWSLPFTCGPAEFSVVRIVAFDYGAIALYASTVSRVPTYKEDVTQICCVSGEIRRRHGLVQGVGEGAAPGTTFLLRPYIVDTLFPVCTSIKQSMLCCWMYKWYTLRQTGETEFWVFLFIVRTELVKTNSPDCLQASQQKI